LEPAKWGVEGAGEDRGGVSSEEGEWQLPPTPQTAPKLEWPLELSHSCQVARLFYPFPSVTECGHRWKGLGFVGKIL
jgi:hypothetical protein